MAMSEKFNLNWIKLCYLKNCVIAQVVEIMCEVAYGSLMRMADVTLRKEKFILEGSRCRQNGNDFISRWIFDMYGTEM